MIIKLKNAHMGEGSGREPGRVGFYVGNRGSGRVNVSTGRVGSKKSDPWTSLISSTVSRECLAKGSR